MIDGLFRSLPARCFVVGAHLLEAAGVRTPRQPEHNLSGPTSTTTYPSSMEAEPTDLAVEGMDEPAADAAVAAELGVEGMDAAARLGLPVKTPEEEAKEREDAELLALRKQVLEEEKRKRAERFNMEVGEEPKKEEWPGQHEGVPWSLYKKQQLDAKRKPARGPAITTGFDISTADERAKAATRLAKFDPEAAEKLKAEKEEKDAEFAQRAKRMARFGGQDLGEHGAAWTRFEAEALRPLALSAEELLAPDADRSNGDAATTEKLHVRVLPCDRGLFKKLRSNDLEGHFAAYGASYVEWLGEQSVNIWFPDAENAARARLALTRAIPDAPASLGDADVTQWTLTRIAKAKGDAWGRKGTAARCLVRFGGAGDVLAAKPKFANPDPTRKGKFKPPKKKRGRGKRKLGADGVVGSMESGLGAARGYGTPLDMDDGPSAKKAKEEA